MELGESGPLDWFALRVKSNREKVTHTALTGKGYEAFLPQYAGTADTVRDIQRPLFPGYLFCRFDIRQRLPILTIPGLVHIVGIGSTPTPVDPRELDSLRAVVEAGVPVNLRPAYTVGEKAQVVTGPLAGAEGVVTHIRERHLVVSVSILQRSVSVELRREWITRSLAERQHSGGWPDIDKTARSSR